MLDNMLEVAVALCGCCRGRVARHRGRARRHDDGRIGMAHLGRLRLKPDPAALKEFNATGFEGGPDCGVRSREQLLATLEAMIASNGEAGAFSETCIWPDHPRKRDDEHYG